ncbi:MAG TPA: type 1 glutamine amidotransferase domain-containing protein [Candidatus Hydromicrobium sp.]
MTKKILLLIENEYRDEEAIYPYYRFKEAGYEVKVVGPEKGKEYRGKYGTFLKSDLSASEANPDDATAIIIPGGNAPDKMRIKKDMVDLVKKIHLQQKVVGAICHGGWMLVEADIIKGKKVTGYISIATDLKNAGGEYLDKEVVVDGNIVTSRNPGDLPAFCKSILELVKNL